MSPRIRRSALYLPASNARAIEKARALPADVVILDLEDAVAPEMKDAARAQAIAAVREGGFGDRELVVRANALDTPWGAEDARALAEARPDAVLVPKVGSARDVTQWRGLTGVPVWAMIESAVAVLRLDEIAGAGLGCMILGLNDLAREMRCRPDAARTPFLGVLTLAVAAARAHGVAVLDAVYNAFDDDEGLAAECAQAVMFGFDGKSLIHPRQIEICNRAFSPDDVQIAWATRLVAAFDDPENAGKGAIRLDGKMVERLHLEEAHRVLAMAGRG